MDEPLININESQTAAAIRWSKRAIQAEARVATLEAEVKQAHAIRDKVDEECVALRHFYEDHQDDEVGAARVTEQAARIATLEAAIRKAADRYESGVSGAYLVEDLVRLADNT